MPGELVVLKGKHRGEFLRVGLEAITIGRGASCDLTLGDDSKISNKHVRVSPLGNERYLLEDLGSTNGTLVNDESIEQVPLRSGDLIKIGRSLLVFRNDGSAVRLEDIALLGGGSSEHLARRKDSSQAAKSSSAAAPRNPSSAAFGEALDDLVRAAGETGLQPGLDRLVSSLRASTNASRALAFLRHPMTGGLGCAAAAQAPGVQPAAPVDPTVLSRAMEGEVAASGDFAAAPLPVLGVAAGALYIDGCAKANEHLGLLSLAGLLAGLHVGLDRSRRLASSATEIVALAAARVTKRTFDAGAQVTNADRLFRPVARQRGLAWEIELPAPVHATADPILFGRGFDKLLEHVLGDARRGIHITAHPFDGQAVRIWVRYGSDAVTSPIDAHGVAGDLRRAGNTLGDGVLAVARACFLMAGCGFEAAADGQNVVLALELEAPGTLSDSDTGSHSFGSGATL